MIAEHLLLQLREFFEVCAPHGLDSIHAVGYVLPASTTRLTAAQKYIFYAVTQLFGIDTKEKFVLLLSFSDGQDVSPAINTVKSSKLFYRERYNFNNSALYACNEDCMQKMFWVMGQKNNKMFLESLGNEASISLDLTKEVLVERGALAKALKNLQEDIQGVSSKICDLQEQCRELKKKELEVSQTMDVVEDWFKIHLEKEKAINCSNCKQTTCEYPATISKSKDIKESKCIRPGTKFKCKKCRCSWKTHRLEAKRYEVRTISKCKGVEGVVKVAEKRQLKSQLRLLAMSIRRSQVELVCRIQEAHATKIRLKEISLNPDPLPLEEYIEFLIQAEKKNSQAGFLRRIEQLEQVKQVRKVWKEILDEKVSGTYSVFPDVMSVLKREGIDFQSLESELLHGDWDDETPRGMIETFKTLFKRLGKNSKKK
ncbi:unnamed protein product [Darwinula stevensoni]|uniref:Uncharacterized protein n=1 Tax=Darwinula stevensoni TaxID=69355 RepID=A0A7R9AGU3_9CRUS|nr:unnamed protein product [Darwinula stevensoni]CAG0904869.1 unnamed protein product [Darwinula stevensoni]